jgi:LmbE family N-acetylglucosaminyl deacetylase
MTEKRTLMTVFAHPDDEAFGTGGTLTRYAAEGHDVYLVTATRGEAGLIQRPGPATPANLPQVREHELRCACEIYGIHPPRFLDYVDGQLPAVHQGQAVGKVVRLIRELRPDVLITFGPDGIYGPYDHIAAHHWATIGVELAADPECFPDLDYCQPHQAAKVYYRSLTEGQVQAMAEGESGPAVMMDGVPFAFIGYPEAEITTVIDVSDYVEQKLAGIRCHATQVAADNHLGHDEAVEDPWFRRESYILARSTVGRPAEVETDLLARLGGE